MANTNTYIDKIVVPNGSDTITASLVDTVSGYTKMFKVTLEYHHALNGQPSYYTVDKTYAEILAAYTAGDFVYLYDDTTTTTKAVVWIEAPLVAYNEDQGGDGSFIFESHNQSGFISYEVDSTEGVAVIYNSFASASHTHGNITNGGTLQTSDITIATGDKLVVTDNSDSGKIARSSLSFDTTNTTDYLRKDGTWATVSSGSSTDVQINGTSITSGGVANIITNTAYNASSNKVATMSDMPIYVVSVSNAGGGVSLNHTYDEITAAITNGKTVVLYDNASTYIPLDGYNIAVMMDHYDDPAESEVYYHFVSLSAVSGGIVLSAVLYTLDWDNNLTIDNAYVSNSVDATNASNVGTSQFTNTSYVTYYLPFLNGYTSANRKPYTHNGAALYTRVGTTSAVGGAYLKLGNTTNSGTAGNMRGGIDLYAQSGAYYTRLQTTNTMTANNTLTLPTATGTVALTSDVPSVLTGTTAPTSSQGSDGDIYIRY